MPSQMPSNAEILAYSEAVPWRTIENAKRRFNEKLKALAKDANDDALPLDVLQEAAGVPLRVVYDHHERGNVILGEVNGRTFVMGSFVSERYRFGKPLLKAIVPYNFNPAVNHTNISETETPSTMMRALGAEVELGLYHRDGTPPTAEEVAQFSEVYQTYAHKLGITPQVDHEACMYQVEVHIAPGVGYHKTRQSLDGIMQGLVTAAHATGLCTAIIATYPILSDFKLTDDPKVHSAVDVMVAINNRFPEYVERQRAAKARYGIDPAANVVELFRIQGCHIHLDVAGRSEALGLFTFYTMLRSASAVANSALLKGAPFVNGTCDPEFLCAREYIRRTTVTGRALDLPISPHLQSDGLERFAGLLYEERANSTARALLGEFGLGEGVSAMHNPMGRLRADLSPSKRICTLESTGMPVNVSASRMAAVLTDFEFTHAIIENYYRQYGADLEPMMADKKLWKLVGPLTMDDFAAQQDASDRMGTDVELHTPDGESISLVDFYEMKRRYMHRHLIDIPGVSPREIDDVYMSIQRMLEPPSGRVAETVEQYISDPTCRSTGNWGKILRDSYIAEGGVVGEHNPEAVLRVINRMHDALLKRYSLT